MRTAALWLVALAGTAGAQPAGELDFLSAHTDFRGLRAQLGQTLRRQAAARLAERRAAIRKWTPREAAARKDYLRERMLRALGGLPERTPLAPRVTGVLERDGFRVEKIIFESQPGFYVTANLYLPTQGRPPFPGVLFPLGHEPGGKSYPVWQQMLATLARKGYAALAWDPLGQGERVQLYDADLSGSKAGASTMEHTVQGIQCLLTGDNLARYTVWDGIRALDYLVSRPEVDARRIACTGNSGGGTHTAYLSALDDRIQVAAPSCYLTSWTRLLETIGPQDAEQCLPPWIADGLDHGDFVLAFAPKPYLILSAIRDFFSIAGARETYAEARHVYQLWNASDRIAMTEADDGHGYSQPRRLAAYAWFARWLQKQEDHAPEPEAPLASFEDLQCTRTGQVATSLGGETVHSLNRARAAALRRPARPALEEVRRSTGYAPAPAGLPAARPFGELRREGYRIERLVYDSEPDLPTPALLMIPSGNGGRRPAFVWVDGRGKAAAAVEAEPLVRAGYVVLAIDAPGLGETRSAEATKGGDWNRFFGDYDSATTAMLLGKTLVGMRAAAISRGVDLLAARQEVDASRIGVVGRHDGAVAALHAAALDPRLRAAGLEGMLISYQAVVDQRMHRGIFEHVVPGVLRHYDLPGLAASLAPRPVRVVDLADPMGQPAPLELAKALYPTARRRSPAETARELWGGLLEAGAP